MKRRYAGPPTGVDPDLYVYYWQTVKASRPTGRDCWPVRRRLAGIAGGDGSSSWFILISTGATLGVHHQRVQTWDAAAKPLNRSPATSRNISLLRACWLATRSWPCTDPVAHDGVRGGLQSVGYSRQPGAIRASAWLLAHTCVVPPTLLGIPPIPARCCSSPALLGIGTPLPSILLLPSLHGRR